VASEGAERGLGPLAVRGVVEGFYGPAWSPAERRRVLEFAAHCGLDTYVYAPKDDPYHRLRWREPYPDVSGIVDLAGEARDHGIDLVYALHPYGITASDPAEFDLLAAKTRQLHAAGIQRFALFFDDIPPDFESPADAAAYPAGRGQAHGELSGRFLALLSDLGISGPLLVCPTDYAGTQRSDYRDAFAAAAPEKVLLCWTGRDVVVGDVRHDEIEAASRALGRPIVLWDNFPVNDYAPDRLFLGPLVGRPADPGSLVGILANPMVQSLPSLVALATVGAYAACPARYRAESAWDQAITSVACLIGIPEEHLRVLALACGGWPPSAPRWPGFEGATARALAADGPTGDALDIVVAHAARMRVAGAGLAATEGFGPWGRALAVAADLTGAVCDLLADAASGHGPDSRVALIGAVAARRAEVVALEADVLRPQVLAFADAAIRRADGDPATDTASPEVDLAGPTDHDSRRMEAP
jgi:hypothetical protein